jgi:hypothetical protein
MNAKDFLGTIQPDIMRGLYRHLADGKYTEEADKRVAEHLTTQARVNGFVHLTITGSTLGRFRSSIGLVGKRSTRLGPTPLDPDGAPTPASAQPELVGFRDAQVEFAAWKATAPRKKGDDLLRACFRSGAIAALRTEQKAMRARAQRSDRRYTRVVLGALAAIGAVLVVREFTVLDDRLVSLGGIAGGVLSLIAGEIRDWGKSRRQAEAG